MNFIIIIIIIRNISLATIIIMIILTVIIIILTIFNFLKARMVLKSAQLRHMEIALNQGLNHFHS